MCAVSCLLPAPTMVPGMWQALKCLLYEQNCWVSKAPILDAEISKPPQHNDYLAEERIESEVINM